MARCPPRVDGRRSEELTVSINEFGAFRDQTLRIRRGAGEDYYRHEERNFDD